ncbi:MAG: hypothetical protein AABY47_07925 [Pseudomonadota bacterium]
MNWLLEFYGLSIKPENLLGIYGLLLISFGLALASNLLSSLTMLCYGTIKRYGHIARLPFRVDCTGIHIFPDSLALLH